MVMATLSGAVSSASGTPVPNNPWPFFLCAGILVLFVVVVVAAASLANHREDVREGRARPLIGGSEDQ
jgi:hypothetical protein